MNHDHIQFDGDLGHFWMTDVPRSSLALLGLATLTVGASILGYLQYQLVKARPSIHPGAAIYQYFHTMPNRINLSLPVFYIGVNLVVFCLWTSIQPFLALCAVLFVAFCINVVFGHVMPNIFGRCLKVQSRELSTFISNDIYLDFSTPMSEKALKFTGQCLLMANYLRSVTHFEIEHFNFGYWVACPFTIQIFLYAANYDAANNFYCNCGYIYEVLIAKSKGGDLILTDIDDHVMCISRVQCLINWFASFLVNGVFFCVVLYTVPLIMSSVASPMDYVTGIFTVTFMVDLDNASSKRFRIHSKSSFDYEMIDDSVLDDVPLQRCESQRAADLQTTVKDLANRQTLAMDSDTKSAIESELQDLRSRVGYLENLVKRLQNGSPMPQDSKLSF